MKLTASFQLFVIKATLDYLGKCVEAGPSEWFKARRVGQLQGVPLPPPPPPTHTHMHTRTHAHTHTHTAGPGEGATDEGGDNRLVGWEESCGLMELFFSSLEHGCPLGVVRIHIFGVQ